MDKKLIEHVAKAILYSDVPDKKWEDIKHHKLIYIVNAKAAIQAMQSYNQSDEEKQWREEVRNIRKDTEQANSNIVHRSGSPIGESENDKYMFNIGVKHGYSLAQKDMKDSKILEGNIFNGELEDIKFESRMLSPEEVIKEYGISSSHTVSDPNARETLYEEVYGFEDQPPKQSDKP